VTIAAVLSDRDELRS